MCRNAFKRRHYPVDIIAQCVRWYLAYALSLCNLEEMMVGRGIEVDYATVSRWVHRLVPLFVKRYRRTMPTVGRCWRMDETYDDTEFSDDRVVENLVVDGTSPADAINVLVDKYGLTRLASSVAVPERY